MVTFKQFCEENKLTPERTLQVVIGQGGGILPQKISMQGYFAAIGEDSITFVNDVLGVKKEVPFHLFTSAEFGIGSAQLWLQCVVDGKPFVFCMRRTHWKSDAGKLLLEKIGAHTEILGMKEYNGYTGKLFFLYMWK